MLNHALREAKRQGEVKLMHCKSEQQAIDIFTKTLLVSKNEAMKQLEYPRKISRRIEIFHG